MTEQIGCHIYFAAHLQVGDSRAFSCQLAEQAHSAVREDERKGCVLLPSRFNLPRLRMIAARIRPYNSQSASSSIVFGYSSPMSDCLLRLVRTANAW